jgi:hypothetical protein
MNNESIWTWILLGCELVGITGMLLVGARKWWGWALVLAHSMPWLAYSIVFNKPGFVAMSVMWIGTHTRNMHVWRKNNISTTSIEPIHPQTEVDLVAA